MNSELIEGYLGSKSSISRKSRGVYNSRLTHLVEKAAEKGVSFLPLLFNDELLFSEVLKELGNSEVQRVSRDFRNWYLSQQHANSEAKNRSTSQIDFKSMIDTFALSNPTIFNSGETNLKSYLHEHPSERNIFFYYYGLFLKNG